MTWQPSRAQRFWLGIVAPVAGFASSVAGFIHYHHADLNTLNRSAWPLLGAAFMRLTYLNNRSFRQVMSAYDGLTLAHTALFRAHSLLTHVHESLRTSHAELVAHHTAAHHAIDLGTIPGPDPEGPAPDAHTGG